MADLLDLYPLSTFDGSWIPYDIIRPAGLFAKEFTDSPSSPIAIPTTPPNTLLSVWASNDCVIGIGVSAVFPTDGTFTANLCFIPAQTFMNIDHNAAATLTVRGIRDPGGLLIVMLARKWQDTKKAVSFPRG